MDDLCAYAFVQWAVFDRHAIELLNKFHAQARAFKFGRRVSEQKLNRLVSVVGDESRCLWLDDFQPIASGAGHASVVVSEVAADAAPMTEGTGNAHC